MPNDSPAALYSTRRLNVQSLILSELHNAPPPLRRYVTIQTCAVVQGTTGPWNWYTVINYPSHCHPTPLFLISITSQRDPWEPVVLSTACSGARLFHSKHPALTRQTWHGGLIMPQGEWPARAACLPITPLATSQDLQIRSSSFTWERWSQIAALGHISSLWCVCAPQRRKKKKKLLKSAGGRKSDVSFVRGSGAKSCNS